MEKAFSIDTFVPPNWEFQLGLSRLLLRQRDKALARFNRAIERAPKFTPACLSLAWAYVELDRIDDANNAIKMVLENIPHFTLKQAARIHAFPYRLDEVRDRFLDSLCKAGRPE